MVNQMLSEREQQILCLVAEGLSNRQIAGQLDISENTVKVHVRNIFAKIAVSSRTEASLYAVRAGLIAVPARDDVPLSEPLHADTTPQPPHSDDSDSADTNTSRSPAAPEPQPIETGNRRKRPWVLQIAVGVALIAGLGYSYQQFVQPPPAPTSIRVPDARWQQLPALPQPRAGVLLVVLNGALYAMGGGETTTTQHLVHRYDEQAHTWVAAPALPFALVGGYAWSDGSGVWLIDAVAGGTLRQWDGTHWEVVTTLPTGIRPLQVVRWQGQTVVLGSDGTAPRLWVYDDTWRALTDFPQGVVQAAVLVNAESLLGVSAEGDVFEYAQSRQDWRRDGTIGHRWEGSVATSVLGALIIIQSHAQTAMSAYSPGQGVVGQQMVPAYVDAPVQIVPWQMQLVVADTTGTSIGMYQALYQNFAPIAQ